MEKSDGGGYAWAVEFEWDLKKAARNIRKHRVPFVEAATVFGDPLSVTVQDPDHSSDEQRYITIGESSLFRLILVSHADRGDRIRIISARQLTRAEGKGYEEET